MIEHRSRSRSIAALILLALLSTSLTGCGTIRNIFGGESREDRERAASRMELAAANKLFTDDQVTYTEARTTMRAARIARQVSDDKWLEYRLSQNAIIAAAPLVEADLTKWGETGHKPEMYDAHAKALRDALANVLIVAKEFQP